MMEALDSTASGIWLVISFLTVEEALAHKLIQSRSIPVRIMVVVVMPIRVASFWFVRNFINFPPQ